MPQTINVSHKLHIGSWLMLAAALSLSSACVTQSSYNELMAERDELAAKNMKLEQRRAALADVAAGLGTELALRDQEVDALKQVENDLRVELEAEIIAGEILIALQRDGLHLILPHSVLFTTGSSEIGDRGREVVSKLVDDLQRLRAQVVVIGYTDNVPIGGRLGQMYPTNWELAGARAASVVRVLEDGGVESGRLRAVSAGATNPIASNDTTEGRAENRRIDIRLRPVTR